MDEMHELLERMCKIIDRELMISHEVRLRVSSETMGTIVPYVERRYNDKTVELVSETDCRTSLPIPSEYYLVLRRK